MVIKNEQHTNFILNYAQDDGLKSLVNKFTLDEKQNILNNELQQLLIDTFMDEFTSSNTAELQFAVECVILESIRIGKENGE